MDINGRLWLEEVGGVRIWDGQHFIDAPIEDLEATHRLRHRFRGMGVARYVQGVAQSIFLG